MKNLLRYALVATLLIAVAGDAFGAGSKRPRKRKKRDNTETVAPDTVYIIKYIQQKDSVQEQPRRP